MNIILSLDISSVSTGYAVHHDDQLIAHGVIKKKPKQHGEKLLLLETEINRLVEQYKPNIFSFEDIWKGPSIKTYKILALYHGIAYKASFMHFKKDPIVLMPSQLRHTLVDGVGLELTGKKEQDKRAVFDFMKARHNLTDFVFEKHNDITDAIAVGLATQILLKEHDNSIEAVIKFTKTKKKPKKKKTVQTPKKKKGKSK